MEKKHIIIIALLLLAIILIGGLGLLALSGSRQKARDARLNSLKLASQYLERQEFDRALEILDKLLIADPEDAEARKLLDEILDKKKIAEKDAKDRELEELRRQQENLQDTLTDLSSSLQEKLPAEKPEIAQKEIPEDADAKEREKIRKINELLAKGAKELETKEYQRARKTFSDVLDLDPDSGEAYAYIGVSHLEEDSQDAASVQKAIEASNKAIQKDSSLWVPHNTLGKIYENTRNYDDAISEYKQAARLNPENYMLLYSLRRSAVL